MWVYICTWVLYLSWVSPQLVPHPRYASHILQLNQSLWWSHKYTCMAKNGYPGKPWLSGYSLAVLRVVLATDWLYWWALWCEPGSVWSRVNAQRDCWLSLSHPFKSPPPFFQEWTSRMNRATSPPTPSLSLRHCVSTHSTVCPRSLDPFYIVRYYIKCVKTSWTYSTLHGTYIRW